MKRLLAVALLAAVVLAAPKPVPADPSFSPGSTWDPTYGGTVTFDVTGLPRKGTVLVDVQCYNGSVGWWDTAPADAATFVLGSGGTTAPPDLGNVIVLAWSNFPTLTMDCEARLFVAHKKKGVNVLDTYGFTAN